MSETRQDWLRCGLSALAAVAWAHQVYVAATFVEPSIGDRWLFGFACVTTAFRCAGWAVEYATGEKL